MSWGYPGMLKSRSDMDAVSSLQQMGIYLSLGDPFRLLPEKFKFIFILMFLSYYNRHS